jgi:glutathione reductase (NADPH)
VGAAGTPRYPWGGAGTVGDMTAFDYDLVVIGGGSGGVRAARVAAGHGARVAVVEQDRYGGTCVVRGCIPKKLLVYASSYSTELRDAAGYGWTVGEARFDWPALIAGKDREIQRLTERYVATLDGCGAQVVRGRAHLLDAHTVAVADRILRARVILVATGARPYLPPGPGVEHCITSDEAFELPALPPRVVVVGAGYIALEFAHIFCGLGSHVSLVHRSATVLRGFDDDVRAVATRELGARGVSLHLPDEVRAIERRADGALDVRLVGGEVLCADACLMATGRVPNTADLGLEAAGVELTNAGAVVVDEYSRTSAASVYAVGDCTSRVQLTPAAIREGHAFADSVFGDRPTPVRHDLVPTAVFSQPPIAAIGLTESEARAQNGSIEIYKSVFRPLKHALSGRDEKTLMKLVVDADTQRVLGLHVVGDDAPEIVQAAAIAVTMGATKQQLDDTLAIHPTSAEELVLMRTRSH